MRCIEVIFAIRDHLDRGLLLRELGSVVLLVLCSYYLDNLRADLLVVAIILLALPQLLVCLGRDEILEALGVLAAGPSVLSFAQVVVVIAIDRLILAYRVVKQRLAGGANRDLVCRPDAVLILDSRLLRRWHEWSFLLHEGGNLLYEASLRFFVDQMDLIISTAVRMTVKHLLSLPASQRKNE